MRNDDTEEQAFLVGESGILPAMTEIALGFLVIGVLIISDPDRLQMIVDRLQDLVTWLAE